MNFKSYDILSKLTTGVPISFVLIKVYFPAIYSGKLGEVAFVIALAYIIGFFIDAFSSWLEPFYYFTWGGKPSDKFMSGKGIWKVNVPSYLNEIKNDLRSLVESKDIPDSELFIIALIKTKSDRIVDFQNLYAFSRSLLTSFIILFVLLISHFYSYWLFYVVSIFLILVLWLRAKQRAYYYVREILVNSYINKKKMI